MASARVRRAAVLGSPVSHSLSPVLHRAAYTELALTDWSYDAIECDESQLADLIADSGPEVVGYSCTMPLKREVLRVASAVSEEAAAIGAGNTLLRIDDDWYADNTDWIGIRDAVADRGLAITGNIAVLGAGGTAQAALAALAGAETVTVWARDPMRTLDLLETAERLDVAVTIARLDDEAIGALVAADLVISTAPAGAVDRLALLPWRAEQALLDVVYHPWPTVLARAVTAAGGTVISGAEMLLFQAVRQVELMTGRAAPVQAMRAALAAVVPDGGLRPRETTAPAESA
ncbi:MAG: shikimate dehydrogenase [Pseudonocardiales bacterium]|nr:shikimate dehydrogenase [Pseudonocardiales bacterium]